MNRTCFLQRTAAAKDQKTESDNSNFGDLPRDPHQHRFFFSHDYLLVEVLGQVEA